MSSRGLGRGWSPASSCWTWAGAGGQRGWRLVSGSAAWGVAARSSCSPGGAAYLILSPGGASGLGPASLQRGCGATAHSWSTSKRGRSSRPQVSDGLACGLGPSQRVCWAHWAGGCPVRRPLGPHQLAQADVPSRAAELGAHKAGQRLPPALSTAHGHSLLRGLPTGSRGLHVPLYGLESMPSSMGV